MWRSASSAARSSSWPVRGAGAQAPKKAPAMSAIDAATGKGRRPGTIGCIVAPRQLPIARRGVLVMALLSRCAVLVLLVVLVAAACTPAGPTPTAGSATPTATQAATPTGTTATSPTPAGTAGAPSATPSASVGTGASPSGSPAAVASVPPEELLFPEKLVICSDLPYPPQEYFDANGNPIGSDIELGQEIGRRLGLTVEIVNSFFDTIIPALTGGKCDIILSAQ